MEGERTFSTMYQIGRKPNGDPMFEFNIQPGKLIVVRFRANDTLRTVGGTVQGVFDSTIQFLKCRESLEVPRWERINQKTTLLLNDCCPRLSSIVSIVQNNIYMGDLVAGDQMNTIRFYRDINQRSSRMDFDRKWLGICVPKNGS